MKDIRELLQTRPLLFDGAMGTYYKAAPGVECEQANLTDPAGVLAVHREYLAAGADAVKTNTFSLPRLAAAHTPGWEQLAQAGWQLAVQAAEETGAAVFADLGPAPDTEAVPAGQVYTAVAKQFTALGARNFLFETLSSDAGLLDAVGTIKAEVPDAFVLVSFAVLPDGYTREGMYCKDLARRMQEGGIVDAVGLNCVSAPGAMRTLAKQLGGTLPLSVMPNAGYPVVTRTQVKYQGRPEYFARELGRLAAEKNHAQLVRLLAAQPEQSRPWLVFVGDGPARPDLEALTRELKLTDRIRFAGMVKPDEVPRWYRVGDIFVSASQSETQGLTYFEGMACGLPVLCRADPCLDGVVENGFNGWQWKDEAEFASALNTIISDPALRGQLHQNALATAARYSAEHFAQQVLDAYQQAIALKQYEPEHRSILSWV